MNVFTVPRTIRMLAVLTIIVTITGCSAMPFGRPPGEILGSCKGTMRLESGRRTNFWFDLIRNGDESQIFLTMPGHYRYRPVEDLDIGDGMVEIELSSPERRIRGEIIGDSLTFSGNFKGLSGTLTLDFDN